jgi:thiol-disulfide isomerase/thioredoxin
MLFLVAVTPAWGVGTESPPPVRSAAAAQLRHEFYAQDFSRLAEDGKQMLPQYPKDLELRAWYVVGATLSYSSDGLEAVVEGMKQSAPDNPWTLLADAATNSDFKAKVEQCGKAIAADKTNPDVLVLATNIVQRASQMQSYSQHPPNADDLKKFLAEHKAEYEQSPDAMAAEAQALDIVATIEKDTKETAAQEVKDHVLKSDPDNITALLIKSKALQKGEKYQAAYDLLKAAAVAVPDSYALHMAYWDSVMALPGAKLAEQKQEIEGDATKIFSTVRPSTQIVQSALYKLDQNPPDLGTEMGDLLLKKYPHTGVEDAVLYQRADKDLLLAADDQNLDHKVKALEAFLDRPKHYDDSIVKSANSTLMSDLMNQKSPNLDRLYQTMVTQGGSPQAITILADHKSHLPEIEELAKSKLDSQWTDLQTWIKDIPEAQMKTSVEVFLSYGPGGWLAALGWVEFNEGQLDTALKTLETASKLSSKDSQVAVHLGRIYEAKGDNTKTQQVFEEALSKPYYGEGDHPAVAALHDLYVHVHGSETDVEAYMQPILAKDAARRKAVILSERLKPEKPIPSFTLASLNGKEVASGDLKGKLLVINFWATWCGWCRREFPAFQEFYEKYKNDPSVVILAISSDARTTPDKVVEQSLASHHYTFPVVRGYDYGEKAGVHGIPTTWFVNANGDVAFQKIGYCPNLVEEFSWRLEDMRHNKVSATPNHSSPPQEH